MRLARGLVAGVGLIAAAGVVLFVLYPLVRLLILVFLPEGQVSFDALADAVGNGFERRALGNSLLVGTIVACLTTLTGFLLALARVRAGLPRSVGRVADLIMLLPLISPPFTAAFAVVMLFGARGLITHGLLGIEGTNIYGLPGTVLGEVLTFTPVAYLILWGTLSAIDRTLEDAATDLGASRWRAFRSVTLRLATPGIASALLLTFTESLADFGTPIMLAGSRFPILSVQAYLQVTGSFDLRGGATLALILLIPALAAFVVQRQWVGHVPYTVIGGKGTAASREASVTGLARVALVCFVAVFLVLVVAIYFTIASGAFVKFWGVDNTPTLEWVSYVAGAGGDTMRSTLLVALAAVPAGGIAAAVLGYFFARARVRGMAVLEFASLLNFALPGTAVGIAYIIAFNSGPIILTGTLTILVANFASRYMPAGIRTMMAALRQIDRQLEDAAADLGASASVTFGRVVVPLTMPAILAGLEYLFVRSMTAISSAIFLVSIHWNLVSVQILQQVTEVRLGAASAFSLVLIVVVLVVVSVLRLVARVAFPYRAAQAGL